MGKGKRVVNCLWLYGPSGAGKTTVGAELVRMIRKTGQGAVLIDGDELRNTVSMDLGLDSAGRLLQARRAAFVARYVLEAGGIPVVSLITPCESFRSLAEVILDGRVDFVYLRSRVETRIQRDPKGLYKKAIMGQIKDLTGYNGFFDEPESGLIIDTDETEAIDVAMRILDGR